MAEQENTTVNESDLLRDKARKLNIKFHPSISDEKLREKINEVMNAEPEEAPKAMGANALRAKVRAEATKLIRVRITCMNPAKKEWPGEVITASNKYVNEKKFIPFVNAEEGYHIPQIILNVLKARKFQQFYTEKLPNGDTTRKGKMVGEFAIEILPALTKEELAELAKVQAAAGNIG